MSEHERLTVEEHKKRMKEEALLHGKARSAKVRKLLEVGFERFNKMAAFHTKRANKHRVDAERYYHLYNHIYDTLMPELEALENKLLTELKVGEEVILAEYGIVVAKGCDSLVFEPIVRDDQWVQALQEWRIENRNDL